MGKYGGAVKTVGGLDGAFLDVESATTHMHVCGLLVLDTSTMGGGTSFEAIRSMLCQRLPSIPVVHQKLASAALFPGRPFWVDEPDLEVGSHLSRVHLPPPGDDRALAEVAGDFASRPLDHNRPLWEILMVDGLAGNRVALLVKMHHSIIDGVSGANLMGDLFDLEPDASVGTGLAPHAMSHPGATDGRGRAPAGQTGGTGPRTPSTPGRRPSDVELLGRSLRRALAKPIEMALLLPATSARIGSVLWYLAHNEGGGLSAKPFTAPRTPFNATITGRRSVAFVDVPLGVVKEVKTAFGVSFNDVLTAVVGGALRRYLADRGDLPDRSLIAAEPVSVHHRAGSMVGTTQVSIMFSTLATDLEDRAEAVEKIAAANSEAKKVNEMVGADTLVRWADSLPHLALSYGSRAYSMLHGADHHPVIHNLILSNVAGPPVPLYLAGARLASVYPLGPIMDGAGLNVTVISQEERVGVGMIACPDLIPDLWDLAAAIPDALDELVRLAPRPRSRNETGVRSRPQTKPRPAAAPARDTRPPYPQRSA
jgi:WS/DGAT/MGAT family acyltransferase